MLSRLQLEVAGIVAGLSEAEQTELELGADARLFPAEPGDTAPTPMSLELAVD